MEALSKLKIKKILKTFNGSKEDAKKYVLELL